MTNDALPALEISPYWQSVQDHLIQIVSMLPEDKLDWSPAPELWNSRGILIHVSDARDRWLTRDVQDGEPYPNIWATARTSEDLKRELVRTFDRLVRFLSNPSQLAKSYDGDHGGGAVTYTGHWIAFHLLEHDIHHQAELLQRVALLGIPHNIDI